MASTFDEGDDFQIELQVAMALDDGRAGRIVTDGSSWDVLTSDETLARDVRAELGGKVVENMGDLEIDCDGPVAAEVADRMSEAIGDPTWEHPCGVADDSAD